MYRIIRKMYRDKHVDIIPPNTYKHIENMPQMPKKSITNAYAIFITGATGSLGAYICKLLLAIPGLHIKALVRGDIRQRQEDLLQILKVFGVNEIDFKNKVQLVKGDVALRKFGLDDSTYAELIASTSLTIHSAANISLQYPYEDLYLENVKGTEHIIDFALSTKSKKLIYVSTYSVMGDLQFKTCKPFTEEDFDINQDLSSLGYQKSKFNAEKLIREQNMLKWFIVRPGNIFGDSQTGAYPIQIKKQAVFYDMFKTFLETKVGAFSNIYFDITPIDYVAKAIVYLTEKEDEYGKTLHLTNPDVKTFSELCQLLKKMNLIDEIISADDYINRVYRNQLRVNGQIYKSLTTIMAKHNDKFLKAEGSTYAETKITTTELEKHGIYCPKINPEFLQILINYGRRCGYFKTDIPHLRLFC